MTEHLIIDNGSVGVDHGKVSLIQRNPQGDALVTMEKIKTLQPARINLHKQHLSLIWSICRDALLKDRAVLVFCGTRLECSECANEAKIRIDQDQLLKEAVSLKVSSAVVEARDEAVARLARSMSGTNTLLCSVLSWSVAFHHAGLTDEERKQVENVYRRGGVRLLFATSTLAIGVNLPASVVIQMGFKAGLTMIDCATYMQMAGRAGRAGQDSAGEAYLVVRMLEFNTVRQILEAGPSMLTSAIASDLSNLPRFVLDVIGRGIVSNLTQLEKYLSCSLVWSSVNEEKRKTFWGNVMEQISKLGREGEVEVKARGRGEREKVFDFFSFVFSQDTFLCLETDLLFCVLLLLLPV